MKTRVVVVADIDPSFAERVTSDEQFELNIRICDSEEELIDAVADAHVIVSRAYTPLSATVLHAAEKLELILQGTSGLDNIDTGEADRRGVRVVGAPGVNANAVSEMVVGLMLTMTRAVQQYDRSMKSGDWNRSDCASRHELRHHDVGIVGIGRVGSRVAKLASAFDCTVRAFDPYLDAAEIAERGAVKIDSLDALLAASAIVTVHVPLTHQTRGMIGPAELATIPEGGFFINTSRGEVVDTDALLHNLWSGHLGGVALDVFDPEPPKSRWPSDPRLILTPHVAGCTAEAKSEAGVRMYRELCAFYGFEPNDRLPSR